MSGASYQVFVLNTLMQRLAVLDDYLSLTWTRRWQQPNTFELHCSRYANGAGYLIEDNLIQVVRDGQIEFTAIIEHGELQLDEQGRASEVWTVRGGDIITRRICLPPTGLAYDERSGPAETVMKGYITANVISPADPNRTISLVSNEADGARGASIAVKARYEALTDKLEECARAGGVGWELVGTATGLQFTIVPGVDRSTAQAVNPPIIFSPDFGNLKTLGYQWTMLNRATLAYVAGQGEGAARQIQVVYDGASVPTGTARREAFVDARDLDTTAKLTDRGRAKLSEQGPKTRLEAQILTGGPFRYRTDWCLGDVVTVRNLDWGVLQHLRITEVRVTLQPDSGEQIEVAFGAPPANLISVIRQGIAASEVVQRSEAGGGIGNPMTAAGDLIVGGTDGDPVRLPLGNALQLLRVKSDESGLEWANPGHDSLTVPACRVYHDASQSIPHNSETALAFNSERFDTDTMHDTITNNSRLTATKAGKYYIWGGVQFANNNSGIRWLRIRLNGNTVIAMEIRDPNSGSNSTSMTVSTIYELSAGDYVELTVLQDSGGALNVNVRDNHSPEFGMVRIA